eukprot:6188057-Pleurochrysis_carterae.AAC.6
MRWSDKGVERGSASLERRARCACLLGLTRAPGCVRSRVHTLSKALAPLHRAACGVGEGACAVLGYARRERIGGKGVRVRERVRERERAREGSSGRGQRELAAGLL